MIRYKKKRKYQYGGSSPADEYTRGSSAVASTFTPIQNPYKRMEMQPQAAAKSAGGSKIGSGQFNNAMSMAPLTSSYLPKTAAQKNAELNRQKERLIQLYSMNKQYFNTANGLKELNGYKNSLYNAKNELKKLDTAYKTALDRAEGDAGRIVFTSDNEVFVKNENNQIIAMNYDDAIKYKYKNKDKLSASQYEPLTIGTLLESMDDTTQQKNRSILDINVLLDALGSIVNEKAVATAFNNRIKAQFKDASRMEGEDFKSADGKNILTKEDIKDFIENGVESAAMRNFINSNVPDRATIALFRSATYSDPHSEVEAAILNGGSSNQKMRRKIYDSIMANIVGEAPDKPGDDKAAMEVTSDMHNVALANRYNIAETNADDKAKTVDLDVAIPSYDSDGEVSTGTELVLKVKKHEVPNSGIDIYANHQELLNDDSKDPKKIQLKEFKKLGQIGDISEAVMIDGTRVDQVKFDSRKGFIPIMNENVDVVNMVVDREGNLATWALPIINTLNEVAQTAKRQAEEKLNKSSLRQDMDIEDKRAFIAGEMDKSVKESLKNELEAAGKPDMDLGTFYNEFSYKNFYRVPVVGDLDAAEAFGSPTSQAIKYATEKLDDNAEKTAREYGMLTWYHLGEDIVKTSILVPALGLQGKEKDEKTEFGKAGPATVDLLHSRAKINIRDLFVDKENAALEAFAVKQARK
jgi:hypothetical protein